MFGGGSERHETVTVRQRRAWRGGALLLLLLLLLPYGASRDHRTGCRSPSVFRCQLPAHNGRYLARTGREPAEVRYRRAYVVAGRHLDEFMAYYHLLGITNVRLSLDWKTFEPQPGQYDFAQFDRVLNRLAAEGIEVIASFVAAPAWASPDSAACAKAQREFDKERLTCGIRPDAEPQFREAVRTVAARYPFIRLWEFWNEPELWTYMGHEVADYLRWLSPFYDEIHAINPGAVVAANTLAGFFYVDWLYGVSDNTNGPEKRPWDAISFHPYGSMMKSGADGQIAAIMPGPIQDVRKRMVDAGDANKKLWITEYGWETTPEQQAAFLQQGLPWLLSQHYIEVANLHMLHDWTGEHYGLLTTDPPIYGTGRDIDANTRFVPKEPYFSTYKNFPKPVAAHAAERPRYPHLPADGPRDPERDPRRLGAAWRHDDARPATNRRIRAAGSGRRPLVPHTGLRARAADRPARREWPARTCGRGSDRQRRLAGEGMARSEDGHGERPGRSRGRPCEPGRILVPRRRARGCAALPRGVAAGGRPQLPGLAAHRRRDGERVAAQYFERGRLELHGDAVWFGLVGNEALIAQGWLDAGGGPIANTPTAREWTGS